MGRPRTSKGLPRRMFRGRPLPPPVRLEDLDPLDVLSTIEVAQHLGLTIASVQGRRRRAVALRRAGRAVPALPWEWRPGPKSATVRVGELREFLSDPEAKLGAPEWSPRPTPRRRSVA